MRVPLLLIGLALVVALTALRLADPLPVREMRLVYFDGLQRLMPRETGPAPVRVVDIDEASLARIGQWPWPRHVLADLTERLAAQGAAVVVYDVIFAEPDRLSPARLAAVPELQSVLGRGVTADTLARLDHDIRFAAAMARVPVVLGTARIAARTGTQPLPRVEVLGFGDPAQAALPRIDALTPIVPVLDAAASGVGSVSVAPEGDTTTVRTVPLLWNTADGMMPSLAVEALRVALGEEALILWGSEDGSNTVSALGIGAFDVPTTHDGQIWLHYRAEDSALYIPAADVLGGAFLPEIDGAIVLVGASAAGLLDLRTTALGETVPGVSIHAQIIEQILSGTALVRTDFARGLELAMVIFSGLVVVAVMSIFGPAASVGAGAAAAIVVAGASWAAFLRQGLLIDVTFPLMGGFVAFSLLTVYRLFVTDRDARLIRRSFSRYVAPEVLREIESGGHRIELGGTDREVTVMFSDIRNFTRLSAGMPATRLVDLLNALFATLSDRIIGNRGTIDKFMGDSIMAFWNAPVEMAGHPRLAARAALEMRDALIAFNGTDPAHRVETGLGLATGTACVGNIGSSDQFNYTAIGDVVNVAARVEAICRHIDHDIAATAEVRAGAPDMAWLYAGAVSLKGVAERTVIHILVGDEILAGGEAFAAISSAHAALTDALATGAPHEPALDACREIAGAAFPGLRGFYTRLPHRLDDFPPGFHTGA